MLAYILFKSIFLKKVIAVMKIKSYFEGFICNLINKKVKLKLESKIKYLNL